MKSSNPLNIKIFIIIYINGNGARWKFCKDERVHNFT